MSRLRPRTTGTLTEHWPRFRELADERGGLPRFVTNEIDDYLECDRLDHGFIEQLPTSHCPSPPMG